MYFETASSSSDIAMMVLYLALFIFWLFVFAEILVSRNAGSSVLRYSRFRLISTSFLVLSFLLFFESLYWALATAARIGFLPQLVGKFFYFSWHVFVVKSLILVSGIVFLVLFRKTHSYLEERFSSLYFTQFLDSSVDAVGVLDRAGKVLFWNKGAEELYGFMRTEVLGRSISSFLVPVKYHGHLSHVMKEISESHQPARFRVFRNTKNRGEIEVDITMTPFRDKGEFAGYFGIMRPTKEAEVIDNFDYPPIDVSDPLYEVQSSTDFPERGKQTGAVVSGSVAIIMLQIVSLTLLSIVYLSKPPVQGYALAMLGIAIVAIFFPTMRVSKGGVNPKEISMQLIKALFNQVQRNVNKNDKEEDS